MVRVALAQASTLAVAVVVLVLGRMVLVPQLKQVELVERVLTQVELVVTRPYLELVP